jgi:hypothetical protein
MAIGIPADGSDGNEQLTAMAGALLLVLLAVLGLTIVRIGQLLWLHLFLGLVLVGPVALKLASTGYRFVRYYADDRAYRRRGPPPAALRALAPLVVASTLVVFVTGVLLLLEGPGSRSGLLIWHKVSFFVWLAVTGVHVLGHLLEMPRALRAAGPAAARLLAVAAAVAVGLVVAVALLPDYHAWTSAHFHHHHHHHRVA